VSDPIELVIFDCDGVLVDSERIAIRIDAMILQGLGWSLTEAQIVERFVGRSTESITADIEAHIGRSLPGDWEDAFEPLYRDALARELVPVDGIVEALAAITLPTCVASSGSHDKMRFTLGLTGLYARFRGRIFSAAEVENGKPAPDLFLHAADRMGVAASACVVIEDSVPGVQAACAAGMRVLGYGGGVTPAAWLHEAGAFVFDDMRLLPTLLAGG
jgi:HAD superfamily hydrolase (TIGR01509 family)